MAETPVKGFISHPSRFTVTLQAAALALATNVLLGLTSLFALLLSLINFGIDVKNSIIPSTPKKAPETVFITGASSGIGEYLAYKYAKEGSKNIYITGRNKDRLDAVAEKVRKYGEINVISHVIDVSDKDAMNKLLIDCDKHTPIDLVIANAGVSPAVMPNTYTEEEKIRETFSINIDGVVNTIYPLYDIFIQRKHGQYALVSSLASYGPVAHPAYSASKAAITTLGQCLRRELSQHNIQVTVITPGFVRSAITEERHQRYGLPFYMETDEACDLIYTGLLNNIDVIAFPFPLVMGAWILRSFPFSIQDQISSVINKYLYRPKVD